MDRMEAVIAALSQVRCQAACTEAALHGQVAQALQAAGLQALHEVRLAPGCRIDFVAEGIGIEVKCRRPDRARLLAQLRRYAACGQIGALLVVAPRSVALPRQMLGKPIAFLSLERLWGISLP